MFPHTSHRALALAFAISASLSQAFAGAPTRCDTLAQDVRQSAEKEPSKVLMIVEDALVMNESCACEIIKAAITGSKADVALAKQIVSTAVAVAPKMTPVIVECANNVAPGSADTSDAAQVATSPSISGKNPGGKSPAESIMPPKDGKGDFSVGGNTGIRGVYLMAPAVGGFVGTSTGPTDDDDDGDNPRTKKRRKIRPTPTSPSVSDPKDPKNPKGGFTP